VLLTIRCGGYLVVVVNSVMGRSNTEIEVITCLVKIKYCTV